MLKSPSRIVAVDSWSLADRHRTTCRVKPPAAAVRIREQPDAIRRTTPRYSPKPPAKSVSIIQMVEWTDQVGDGMTREGDVYRAHPDRSETLGHPGLVSPRRDGWRDRGLHAESEREHRS
jgi:hypothetical protein